MQNVMNKMEIITNIAIMYIYVIEDPKNHVSFPGNRHFHTHLDRDHANSGLDIVKSI